MASSDGAKAFGSIMTVITVIGVSVGALVATVRPMNQRIDTLERMLDKAERRMDLDDIREQKDAASIATIREKFTEVETKFNALREISDIRGINETASIDKLERWVRALEREVWTGTPNPGATP